jgi:hypothetical protein
MLVGCGGPASREAANPPKNPVAEQPEAPKTPDRVLASGKATLETKREDGTTAWTVEADSSRVRVGDGGAESAELSGVSGTLRGPDGRLTRFTAERADANTTTRRLVLTGKVKIVSPEPGATLTAEKVRWLDDRELFAAEGNVIVQDERWQFGPSPELWATADLKEVGTPDRFSPAQRPAPRG